MTEWKKKKGFDFFSDFSGFQDMINDLMADFAEKDIGLEPNKPLVMGFNIKFGEGGRPIINRFGNIRAEGGKPAISPSREPLVDVIESEKDITITAELPGVEKKGIRFKLPDREKAVIEVKGERSFYKEITLPAAVKVKTAKAKFKNGVLEICINKEKAAAPKGKDGEVSIE